mgnify:CR=1 FL=1
MIPIRESMFLYIYTCIMIKEIEIIETRENGDMTEMMLKYTNSKKKSHHLQKTMRRERTDPALFFLILRNFINKILEFHRDFFFFVLRRMEIMIISDMLIIVNLFFSE